MHHTNKTRKDLIVVQLVLLLRKLKHCGNPVKSISHSFEHLLHAWWQSIYLYAYFSRRKAIGHVSNKENSFLFSIDKYLLHDESTHILWHTRINWRVDFFFYGAYGQRKKNINSESFYLHGIASAIGEVQGIHTATSFFLLFWLIPICYTYTHTYIHSTPTNGGWLLGSFPRKHENLYMTRTR